MLIKFQCVGTYLDPYHDFVEAHFDVVGSGVRPVVLRIPKPGPRVGERYEADLNGLGIPKTEAPTKKK